MKILFSPVGTTDPIRNDYDGPMLHIIRHYKPDKTILFYTKEMEEKEAKSQLFERYAARLAPGMEIEKHFSGIDNPSNFEAFFGVYMTLLRKIREDHPNDTIIANISSGTPQMISSLCSIMVSTDLNFVPVQVVTPEKGSNVHVKYFSPGSDIDDVFKNLLDEHPDLHLSIMQSQWKDRCKEVTLENFTKSALKSTIVNQVNKYDYLGAYSNISHNSKFFSPQALSALEGAQKRFLFELDKSIVKFKEAGLNVLPVVDSPYRNVLEFYLIMRCRHMREEYAQFFLSISPLLLEMCKTYLSEQYRFHVDKVSSPKSKRPDRATFLRMYPGVLNYIEGIYGKSVNEGHWSLDMLINIVQFYLTDDASCKNLYEEFKYFRSIESELRNSIAHNMRYITLDDIKSKCKCTPQALLKRLDALMILVYPKRFKKEMLDSYDTMNELLKSVL